MVHTMKNSSLTAFRVRNCYTMQEPCARGAALQAPLKPLHNALLLAQNGRICWLGAYTPKALPAGLDAKDVQDLGEQDMLPALINAHTHVQLAHLEGKTLWGQGFVPWLKSLIALLSLPYDAKAISQSIRALHEAGTGYFADYGHGGMDIVTAAAQKYAMSGLFLGEWLGFEDAWLEGKYFELSIQEQLHASEAAFLPPRMRTLYDAIPQESKDYCIPCAHALYSTASQLVQKIHAWCSNQKKSHKRPFVLHLAEFSEEVEALTQGTGALVDLFRESVLPKSWKAPGMHPVDFAMDLGVITENTLAVHGVHCEPKHVQAMAQRGASVCLCPRSNAHLAVGQAPVHSYLSSQVNLCLGTDGLSSNTSLDVWQEALYLQKHFSVQGRALLRMLTVNGAFALGVHNTQSDNFFGSLQVGGAARWTFIPPEIQI